MLQQALDKLQATKRNAKPVYLEATEHLEDKSPAELKALYRDFKGKFTPQKAELVKLLGKPKWSLPADRKWFDGWYPECLQAAAWEREGKYICLAVEHCDKELPVALVIRCLTQKEMSDLSAE